MSQVVKVTIGTDTRRFSIDRSRPLSELVALIQSTFTVESGSKLALSFVDDENDECTLSTDDELREAFRVADTMKGNILRLHVAVSAPAEPAAVAASPALPVSASPTPVVVPTPEPSPVSKGKEEAAAAPADDALAQARAALEGFVAHVLDGQHASIQPQWLNDLFNEALSAWGGVVGLIERAEKQVTDPNLVKDAVDALLADERIRSIAAEFEIVRAEPKSEAKPEASPAPAPTPAVPTPSALPPLFAGLPDGSKLWEGIQQSMDPLLQAVVASPFAQYLLNAPTATWGLPATGVTPASTPASSSPVVHPHVTCDGCEGAIAGVRYKCTICRDFDLCAPCEARNEHDATHVFLKINRPVQRPIMHGPLLPNFYSGEGGSKCGRFNRSGCPASRRCPAFKPQTAPTAAAPATTPTPAVAPASEAPKEAAQPTSRFVQDQTIPDGTEMAPETQFVKIWQFRNDGQVAWPAETVLDFVGGDQMDGKVVPVASLAPGELVDVAVEMTAPRVAGRYCGYWRLRAGELRFGHRVWADVSVVVPSAPAPETPRAEAAVPAFVAPAATPAPDVAPAVVVPAPVPVPVAEEDSPLKTLAEMGFLDEARNIELLARHNNDVVAVINVLFG